MNGYSAERQVMTVPEVAAALGISRGAAYDAIRRGELPSRRVGRRILVPTAMCTSWLSIANALYEAQER